MGQKHLIKTITHSWRVGVKIMSQFKEVSLLNRLITKKEGRAKLFSAITYKIDTGLPALVNVVALCSNRSKCSDRSRMQSKRSYIAFPVV